MSEAGYVELPVIQWLSGHPSPTDNGLGWQDIPKVVRARVHAAAA